MFYARTAPAAFSPEESEIFADVGLVVEVSAWLTVVLFCVQGDPPNTRQGGLAMGDLVHRSKVRIVPEKPGIKQAFVEPFPQAIRTGVHGGVKAWYKYEGDEELPTTIDHVVAAIAS
jgi:hypothetical protein